MLGAGHRPEYQDDKMNDSTIAVGKGTKVYIPYLQVPLSDPFKPPLDRHHPGGRFSKVPLFLIFSRKRSLPVFSRGQPFKDAVN